MAETMRPFPQYSRMIDEHGLEKAHNYASLGGESELSPLNPTADFTQPLRQKPDADSTLGGACFPLWAKCSNLLC